MMGCFDVGGSTSKNYSYLPSQAGGVNRAIATYLPTLGKGANIFPGQRVAGLTPSQKSVFDFAEGGGFVTSPEATEQYFQNVVKAPTMKSLREDVIPSVKEAYSGPGYWSSARAKAESKATEDTMANLNTARNQLFWDVGQANKQGALQQLGVGTAEQAYNQDVINAEMQKFAQENQITDPENLNILMQLLGMGMGWGGGESWQPGLGAQNIASILAGAAQGAKMMGL